MERNAFLAGTPLFSGVASQEVGAMLDCLDAHERRYAQGERIHHMGDSVSTAGIVLTGRVRIEHVDPWGNVRPTPPPASRCSWTSSPTRTAPSSS